jgi:hypothetical protein
VPALSSSLISPALEQLAGLPAGERELLAAGHSCPGLLEYSMTWDRPTALAVLAGVSALAACCQLSASGQAADPQP